MWGALFGWFISYFISINSHISCHPYQLDPVKFCQFHRGLTAVCPSINFHCEHSLFYHIKFEHFHFIFVGVSFDINMKEHMPQNGHIALSKVGSSSSVQTSWSYIIYVESWPSSEYGSQYCCSLAAFATVLFRCNTINTVRNLSWKIPAEAAYGVWIIRQKHQYSCRDDVHNMLTCMTIEKIFFYSLQCQWFHCANTDFGFRGFSCFFFFTCCVAYQFVSFCTLSTTLWWRIFQVYPSESCLQLYGNFYLSMVLQKMQASESVLSILLKACICTFRNGPTCSLPACTWTTSSSLLRCYCCCCCWKGEFTLHMSLSVSSLKLPPSESKYFTISLTLSVLTVSLWSIFWTTTPSSIFHCVLGTWNISYL